MKLYLRISDIRKAKSSWLIAIVALGKLKEGMLYLLGVIISNSIMGMRTTIYGYIEEMDFWKDPIRRSVRKHNSTVIKSLPKGDTWPPLSVEMFAICNNYKSDPGPNFEYFARIIHFGANLKSVEHDWIEWKTKFEILLTNLFF